MSFDASAVRHELRTPVNHVIGYSDLLLEEGDLPEGLSTELEDVKALARQALTVIAGILDDDEDVSQASVTTLSGFVGQLRTRAGTLTPSPAHEADLDRIRTGAERLSQLVEALRRPNGSAVHDAPAASDAAETQSGAETATVLVVDDDEANRNVLSRRLFRLGLSRRRS